MLLLRKRILLPMFVLAWAAMIACASRPAPIPAAAAGQLDQPSADQSQQAPPFHSSAAVESKDADKEAKKDGKIDTGSVLPPQKLPAGTPIANTLPPPVS